MKKIFIISGPSGSGQDTIINNLKKHLPIKVAITTTTREMRPGEKQGKPYHFITKREFKKRLKNNEFFEHAETDRGNLYGLEKKEINKLLKSKKIPLIKIDYQGVRTIKKHIPNAIAFYIKAPLPQLERRIRNRCQVTDVFVKARLRYASGWERNKKIFDYVIMNEDGNLIKAVNQIKKIINNSKPHA